MNNIVEVNKHHYHSPSNFFHHAWRNPELEKLLIIIKKFANIEVQNEIVGQSNRS